MVTVSQVLLLSVAICMLGVQQPVLRPGQAPPDTSPAATKKAEPTRPEPVVSVKQTAPVRVAYLEHVGPYWAVSAIVAEVQNAMGQWKEPGPLFIRYLGDPRSQTGSSMRMHVGCVLQGTSDPGPPFAVDRWPTAHVAYVLLDRAAGTAMEQHTRLMKWAAGQGYEPIGPVTELYWIGGSPTGREVIEVQLTLKDRSTEPQISSEPKSKAANSAVANENVSQAASESAEAQVRAAGALENGIGENKPEARSEVSILGSREAGALQQTRKPLIIDGEGRPSSARAPGEESRQAQEEFLLSAEPEAVADLLLGNWDDLSDDQRIWLAQFVAKLAALQRGLERRDQADSTERLRLILATITHKHATLQARGAAASGSESPVRFADRKHPRGALTYQVDRFLSQVAMGSVSVETIERTCMRLINDAHDVLKSDGP